MQDSLFASVSQLAVPGLRLIEEFISKEQEAAIIAEIDRQPWLMELRRRVQHYGFKYDYRARDIDESMRIKPIPEWALVVAKPMRSRNIFSGQPDQMIVNEYLPGQGISAHVDCVPCFGPVVASLSLQSNIGMKFRAKRDDTEVEVYVPRRSLLVLEGDARFLWTHEIPARKSDRVAGMIQQRSRRLSCTYRTVKID